MRWRGPPPELARDSNVRKVWAIGRADRTLPESPEGDLGPANVDGIGELIRKLEAQKKAFHPEE